MKIDVHKRLHLTWQSLSYLVKMCKTGSDKPWNKIYEKTFFFHFAIMQICMWRAKMLIWKGYECFYKVLVEI